MNCIDPDLAHCNIIKKHSLSLVLEILTCIRIVQNQLIDALIDENPVVRTLLGVIIPAEQQQPHAIEVFELRERKFVQRNVVFLAQMQQPMVNVEAGPIREVLLPPGIGVQDWRIRHPNVAIFEFIFDGGFYLRCYAHHGRDH